MVAYRETDMGHLFDIQPDSHGIFIAASHTNVADAVQSHQRVANPQKGKVTDIKLIPAVIRGIQMHHHQHVGNLFASRDTDLSHGFGQPRFGYRNAVLDHHLSIVQICAQFESHS